MPESEHTEPSALSDEIRDGLLQDLVAVSLILRNLGETETPGARDQIAAATAAIKQDVEVVRDLITRLRAA